MVLEMVLNEAIRCPVEVTPSFSFEPPFTLTTMEVVELYYVTAVGRRTTGLISPLHPMLFQLSPRMYEFLAFFIIQVFGGHQNNACT
jgi:hypothetical protein